MRILTIALCASVLLVSAFSTPIYAEKETSGKDKKDSAGKASVKKAKITAKGKEMAKKLKGDWISADINTPSLLFEFVDTIGFKVKDKGRFEGTATLIEGTTLSSKGDYWVEGDDIFKCKIDQMSGTEKATFWFKGDDLYMKDKALNLVVHFKRKKKGSGSGGSWF